MEKHYSSAITLDMAQIKKIGTRPPTDLVWYLRRQQYQFNKQIDIGMLEFYGLNMRDAKMIVEKNSKI